MKRSFLFLLWLIINGADVTAVVTSDVPGSHTTDIGTPAFGVDLDGVVIIGGLKSSGLPASICSGALISDRHVLSAAHCFDTNSDSKVDPELSLFPTEIVFESADGWLAIDYDPAKVQWPQAWPDSRGDLAIVTLEADAPVGIPRYQLYGGSDEVGQPFVLAGYGLAGHGPIGMDDTDSVATKRAGLNRYDAVRDDFTGVDFLVYDFDSGLDAHNGLKSFGLESDLGFGDDEVMSAEGDSGGPGFLNGAIASVVAFGERLPEADTTDQLDASWGEAGFDTRVSIFREFILDATAGTAVFTAISGDLDGNGRLQPADIDSLSLAIRQLSQDARFDMDKSGTVDASDRAFWVHSLAGTFFGDADLNGQFNRDDLVRIFQAGEYEDGLPNNSNWATGDWNGDGDFTTSDLALAFQDGGYEQGPLNADQTVPEPTCIAWLTIVIAFFIEFFRPTKRALYSPS